MPYTVTSSLAGRFDRFHGEWSGSRTIFRTPLVGLLGAFTSLQRDPVEIISGSFEVVRTVETRVISTVSWRVEGVGATPIMPELFPGGLFPEGDAAFAPGQARLPFNISLSPGASPPIALQGRVVLFDAEGCQLNPSSFAFNFEIEAGDVVVGDAIVGLDVAFTELDPAAPGGGGAWTSGAGTAWANSSGVAWSA